MGILQAGDGESVEVEDQVVKCTRGCATSVSTLTSKSFVLITTKLGSFDTLRLHSKAVAW